MAETVDGSGSFFPVLKDDGAGQQAHRGVFQFDAAKNNNFTLSVPGLAAKTGEFMRIVIMSVSDENGRVLAESENFRIGTSEAAAEVTITFNNTTHPDDNSTDSVVNYDFSQNPSRVLKVGVGYGIIVGTYSEDLFTGKFFGTSNEFGIQAAPRPIVTTPTVASITKTSATLGGNVSNGGGTAISVQGVVYALTATNSTPMIGGTGVVTVTDSTVTPGTFAVNATNLTPGTSYTFAAYATNSSGTTYSPTSSFTTVTLSALESWRQTWFGSSENTGNAADTADPYGTGVPNLAVFAFFGPAQNPATTRADNLPQMQLKGGYLVYSFTSPSGISGITYGAEWSTTLKAGSWLPITDTGTARQHIFSLPLGANGGLFMRLRVTSP
jgi:hypothetical protein